jgi:hypothetical protein
MVRKKNNFSIFGVFEIKGAKSFPLKFQATTGLRKALEAG